jgi:hypothetical protein
VVHVSAGSPLGIAERVAQALLAMLSTFPLPLIDCPESRSEEWSLEQGRKNEMNYPG